MCSKPFYLHVILENSESYMKKWKVRLMSKQESLKFLQGLIDEVENWTKEDIERGRKLMEKMKKEEPKEVENSDGYWEFIMPDGKEVK